MEEANKVNTYTCDECGNVMVTQNKDDGVTPFMIGCDCEGCEGLAKSGFYRVPQMLAPDYYWVKLTEEEIKERAEKQTEEVKGTPWEEGCIEHGYDPKEIILEELNRHASGGGLFKVKVDNNGVRDNED